MTATHRDVRSPADGQLLGHVPVAGIDELMAAVDRARTARAGWAAAAPHHRAELLGRAADALDREVEQLAVRHAVESGKVLAQAQHEVRGAVRLLRTNAELGRTAVGELAPTGSLPGGERDITLVERVPLGVVVAVVPFNFPVELTIEKAAAGLAAGNVVIVKVPPQNPLVTTEVVGVLARHLPEGVLQHTYTDTPGAAALCAADGVDAVSLTGSVGAGISVASATAPQLRPLHLELGGNGAAIVRPDADLDHVVAETLRGRLLMNGQACAATKRLVVHRAVAAELTDRLVAALTEVHPVHPLDPGARLGPLIDATAAARVESQVLAAVASGADRILGAPPDGAFVGPTVLSRVPHEAAILHDDEVFGPVFPIAVVEDDDQAVALANATRLRLTAAVFSTDLTAAIGVADQLDFGGVVVNGTNNYRPPVVPFGGVDLAGAGREGAGWTFTELTRTRFLALRGVRPPGRAPLVAAPPGPEH